MRRDFGRSFNVWNVCFHNAKSEKHCYCGDGDVLAIVVACPRPEVHELTEIFVFEWVLFQILLSAIAYDTNGEGRKVWTRAHQPVERLSKFLRFIHRSALGPRLSESRMKYSDSHFIDLWKNVTEETINLLFAVEIDVLVMASGSMFGIPWIIRNATINTKSKFGDSGGGIVIDAKGHRAVGYCLVPKRLFKQKADAE